jgi:protein O-mannosyl-transferase
LAAFLLALLSKTAVVMLPVVLLGCVWWRRDRIQLKDLLCSTPFFALSLVSGLVTIWFHYEHVLRVAPVRGAGFMVRLVTAGWVPWFYLYKALLPVNLMMIYPLWRIDASRLISYVPGAILIGSLTLFWWERKTWGRPLFFGLGYFVVMLFPVLGFFDQSFYQFSLVADHWQYYSIVGVTALAGAGAVALGRRFHRGQPRVIGLVAGVVVIVLGALSWQRCLVYRNQETLFRDNLLRNPLAWVAHNNLGFALKKAGRTQEAVGHYERALQINPDFAAAHYNLGVALQQTGRLPEAIGHYEQALRINPDDAAAQNNLAIALQQTGRLREAIGHYEQALRIDPDDATAYNNLAGLLATLAPTEGGDPVRAVPLAQRACELTGNQAAVYLDTLAIAYAAAGRFNDAIATAQKAIDLARSAGQAQLVREIEMRLELYRVGRAHL